MSTLRADLPVAIGWAAAVVGWSVHVPGADLIDLLGPAGGPDAACPADRAHELLGRKGLLYKEPATRLALCAVHRGLGRAAQQPRPLGPADPRTAVVASSNLGNVATVAEVVRIVRAGSGRDVSVLAAPNASSNVVASTVALWFRLGGPNLMLCSGATAGLDAVALGCLLLHTDRADRVVVVGVEPDDESASGLLARRSTPATEPLRAAAACVVLRPVGSAPGSVVLSAAHWSDRRDTHPHAGAPDDVVLGPPGTAPGARLLDLTARIGDTYGALGVLQVAVGAELIAGTDAAARTVLACCGDDTDGWCSVRMSRFPPAPDALPGVEADR